MCFDVSLRDEVILERVRVSPEQGFSLLMKRFREPVYWHIRRMVVNHEDAQDASQEVFVRIFRSIRSFKGDASLASWIYRIATNEALRLLGKRCEKLQVSPVELVAEEAKAATANYVDYTDLEAVRLQQAIQSLPTKQKIVFTLRYYDEMDYNDIAQVAGCSPGSAKANYHIAKETIIKYMNQHD